MESSAPASTGLTINGRYRLETELGRGGMGVVFRARDETLHRDVALKLLSETRIGSDWRARLLHEAQTVASLRHPNIVVVHDAGEHAGAPFIVMELVHGTTLLEQNPETYPEIAAAAAQICRALEYAHVQGIVHRDLKPENVIREPSGNLKLMDFGLARSAASRLTQDGALMGTVSYMAPEQVSGTEVDGRTDLYALGVMLYEFVTGAPPFEADNPVAVLTQHLTAPVVPPRARRADCPPPLNDLILALLAKDKGDRPESAAVLALLEDEAFLSRAEPAPDPVPALERIARGRMVGREPEAETARTLWIRTLEGRGETLLISGEPGIGKSSLVRELMTRVELGGGLALFAAAFEEGGVPYAVFRQILRVALREERLRALPLPEETLRVLLGLVPDLRANYPDLQSGGGSPEQGELFEHFTVFLNLAGAGLPLLLVLDDIHWADSGSLALMRHIARSTRRSRVMLAATYREVELDSARPLHEMLLDFDRNRIGVRAKLLRLDREQTRRMLFGLLEVEITDDFLEGIYRETEGNPFFVEEVCRALVDSGQLVFEDGVWHRPSIAELGIPQGVRIAIQSRFHRLPERVQEIIGQAAVIGREFGSDTLADATGAGGDDLIEALEEAERAQLIEAIKGPEKANFRFLHALIPTSIVEGFRILKQRSLFRRAAGAIERRYPDRIEVLANYFLRAGDSEQAVGYLVRVGDRARLAFANREAIEAYLQAGEFLEDRGDAAGAADVRMKLGLAYQQTFDFEAANRAQQEAFRLWQQAAAEVREGEALEAAHELHIVYKGEVLTFDPNRITDQFSFYASLHLFDRLVAINAEANILPGVAGSWQVLDGGRRYVFELRDGVRWSDGAEVTAEDFAFSFSRRDGTGPGASITGAHAVEENVLEITLSAPVGDFLYWLAAFGAPVPRHLVERHGERWTDPEHIVVNGMFAIERYDTGRELVLVRNPHYQGQTASNITRIHWDLASEEGEALEKYARGEVGLFYSNGLSTTTRRSIRSGSMGTEYVSQPGLNTVWLEFNHAVPPFEDRRVRRALGMALELEAYRRTNPGGFDIAAGGLIPPGMAGYTPGIHLEHDPEEARRLLAEAGFPGGAGFPPIRARTFVWGNYGDLEIFSRHWQDELGIESAWEVFSAGVYMQRRWDPDWGVRLFGWYADTVDPGNILSESRWFRIGEGVRWENEEFHSLVTRASRTIDQEERIALFRQADRIVAEEAPILPICHLRGDVLIKPWVKGFPLSASTPFDLRNVRIVT
ncbi:MAG TPA: ABC transporter substrate-binding protein [Anaerolineales bacterium]|nr:ABC transporter substrate-binding protein [Anaerolineales bacterium]